MPIKILLIFTIISGIIFTGCDNTKIPNFNNQEIRETQVQDGERIPKDFAFIYEYKGWSRAEIDTFENKLKIDLGGNGVVEVDYKLKDEDLLKIYNKMVEINVFNYPEKVYEDSLHPSGYSYPYLKIRNGLSAKEVEMLDNNKKDVYRLSKEQINQFYELCNLIETSIVNSSEYKEKLKTLPPVIPYYK